MHYFPEEVQEAIQRINEGHKKDTQQLANNLWADQAYLIFLYESAKTFRNNLSDKQGSLLVISVLASWAVEEIILQLSQGKIEPSPAKEIQ